MTYKIFEDMLLIVPSNEPIITMLIKKDLDITKEDIESICVSVCGIINEHKWGLELIIEEISYMFYDIAKMRESKINEILND